MTAPVDGAPESARDAQQWWLLVATAIAVIGDTMLGPFYPNLFARSFGVTDPQHVGLYLAATCLTVMIVFPFWAWLEKRVPTLWLLVFTQFAAGVLGILSSAASDLVSFWVLSLGMLVFRGSYLLIYPYLMRIQHQQKHAQLIGILSVIVHLGGITGATFGGWMLQSFDPQRAFLFMALGDFIQIGGCLWLLMRWPLDSLPTAAAPGTPPKRAPAGYLLRLCIVHVVFYFSVFLGRPFFADFWAFQTHLDSSLVSGMAFAIPGWIAVLCVWAQRKYGERSYSLTHLLLIGMAGLCLQMVPHPAAIIVARCLFGFALFYLMVRLDLLLFEASTPEAFAIDFSHINFSQQLGVLLAFYAAGSLVAHQGLVAPLVVGVFGFALTVPMCLRLLGPRSSDRKAL
jgi:predicted MFS family arabinose efflux permease